MQVLIVDDDASMRALVRKVPETVGHQVLEAGDSPVGMEMALGFQPRLAIVDWVMRNPAVLGDRRPTSTKIGRGIYIW